MLFLQEQRSVAEVVAAEQAQEPEQLQEPQPVRLRTKRARRSAIPPGPKQVELLRVRLLELQQAATLPALDPKTSCIRKRAILPTAMRSPEKAFDDS